MTEQTTHSSWQISESMPMELDVALTVINGYFIMHGFPEEVAELVSTVSQDTRAELNEMIDTRSGVVKLLEPAAFYAGTLLEGDFDTAIRPIREMTAAHCLERLAPEAEALGCFPDPDLSLESRLVDLATRMITACYLQLGFQNFKGSAAARQIAQDFHQSIRILRGGDLYTRFWRWLDRFYSQTYLPWRESRVDEMRERERKAVLLLGDQQGDEPPNLAWLSHHNTLFRSPELHNAIQDGKMRAFFWSEPFEMPDLWTVTPGVVVVSYAEPGEFYDKFEGHAADVARRAKALGDPNRLLILRLIRHFSVINTEIAAYMGLSRPTVSIHAKILREAGLISSQQEGRVMRHEINPGEIRRFVKDLESLLGLPLEDIEEDSIN
jgi:DNA-binding transcriptional ArsR family regulator